MVPNINPHFSIDSLKLNVTDKLIMNSISSAMLSAGTVRGLDTLVVAAKAKLGAANVLVTTRRRTAH